MIQYKTSWTADIALKELRRWCAVQERSHEDVRLKLIEHRIFGDVLEEIISTLISEDFLNETRYAEAYVSGKFRINEWGRNKILAGLKAKKISTYNINKALKVIDDNQYQKTMEKHFNKKAKTVSLKTKEGKSKVMNFLLQKGFEMDLILKFINKE